MKITDHLMNNKIAVLKTDTLYGLVARADSPDAVEEIYGLKKRDSQKPLIILISSIEQISLFDVALDESIKKKLANFWPGKVSIILDVKKRAQQLEYLHRGSYSLAFRLPQKKNLTDLIGITGPLVAPSANPQGMEPAVNIAQAKEYFGNSIEYYLDEGEVFDNTPSKIIKISPCGEIIVVRN